jgi:hypothetical protein
MSLRCFNPQFFIGSRVGDTALDTDHGAITRSSREEMHILVDAVRALSAAVPLEQMPPGDRVAVNRFQKLAQEMSKAGARDSEVASFSTVEVDELISRLRRLRRDDPESADTILRRLSEETVL